MRRAAATERGGTRLIPTFASLALSRVSNGAMAVSTLRGEPPLIPRAEITVDMVDGMQVELGRGAFSIVYAAQYRGQPVALKKFTLPPHATGLETELSTRKFQQEVARCWRLRHPNIMPVLGTIVPAVSGSGGPRPSFVVVMPRMSASLRSKLHLWNAEIGLEIKEPGEASRVRLAEEEVLTRVRLVARVRVATCADLRHQLETRTRARRPGFSMG